MSQTRLLIAVSSPWASQKLLEPLGDMVRRLDGEAVVAHVSHQRNEDEHETEADHRAEETLKILTDGLEQQGVAAEGVVLFSDDIAKAILNTARSRSCTMIVLGTSPKGPLTRLLKRDVPTNLLAQTDIPVLLCPASWTGVI